jgi:hypothetical protein
MKNGEISQFTDSKRRIVFSYDQNGGEKIKLLIFVFNDHHKETDMNSHEKI